MKRLISLAILIFLITLAIASCGGNKTNNEAPPVVNDENSNSVHIHSFGEWAVTKEPSCYEEGLLERSCECGAVESKKIDYIDHVFGEGVRVEFPTCEAPGIIEAACVNCGKVVTFFEPQLPHVPITLEAVESTCTSEGLTYGKACKNCGIVLVAQSVVPVLAHEYVDDYDRSCEVCGFIREINCPHLSQIKIPPVPATCTATGLTGGKKCTQCGEITVKQEIVSAKGHKNAYGVCSACQLVLYSEGLEFTSTGNSTCHVSGIGSCTDSFICIPLSAPDGKIVTGIADGAFVDSNIEGIRISENIVSIASNAFNGCSNLLDIKVVEANEKYMDIDGNLYSKDGTSLLRLAVAKQLGNFTVPDTVTNIGANAFYGARISRLNLSIFVQMIAANATTGCDLLTDIYYGGGEDHWNKIAIISPNEGIDNATVHFKYSKDLAYTSNGDGTCYVSGVGRCKDSNILIPPISPDGDAVTAIGRYAFSGSNLQSIEMPESITVIGEGAFSNCQRLDAIKIPDGVTEIAPYTFDGCAKIDVEMPSTLTKIGAKAFRNCDIEELVIPECLMEIGEDAFYDCYASKVYVDSLETWVSIIFANASSNPLDWSYENYNFYVNNQAIGGDIVIPDGVTRIGDYAFIGDTNITTIKIPDSVTYIGDYAFYYCTGIKSVELSDSLTYIGNYAFSYCWFTNISIPDSVTTIGDSAFSYCELDSISIGENSRLSSIGDYAFTGCPKIININLPNSLTNIGKGAFNECRNLKSIDIPDNVMEIKEYTFYGCRALTTVDLPDNLISIGGYAFVNCYSLIRLEIPAGVTSIANSFISTGYFNNDFSGQSCFVEICNRSGVDLSAFATRVLNVYTPGSGASKLRTDSDGYVFYEDGDACYLVGYVGKSDELSMPNDCNGRSYVVCNYALAYLSTVTSIKLPDGLITIMDYMFMENSSLVSVDIPDTVTTIGSSAFYYCVNLKSITIPDSVTRIGNHAFNDCEKLESVIFGADSQLLSFGEYAFYDCESLESIVIPKGVTGINYRTFCCCDNLKSVTFAQGTQIKSIGDQAFVDCDSLTDVYFCGSNPTIKISEDQNDSFKKATKHYYYVPEE